MNIVVSANNNEELLVFPVVSYVEVSSPQANEDFQTINIGKLNLIGDLGLRTLSISSIFPNNDYKWIKEGSSSEGWRYVDFFNKWRSKKIPFRIIITTDKGKEWLNMACTVDNFTYGEKRNGDISYALDLKEYKFVGV